MNNWSKSWKSSNNPSKQRLYRRNAPQHVKEKFFTVNLDSDLRDELETRNLRLRTGDRVKVMRGDFKGQEGIVKGIDLDNEVVYASGITLERIDGTVKEAPLRPSNLQIKALNIDDESRLEEYEIDDLAAIEVDEEEMEEALEEDEEGEMMQRLQEQEETGEDEESDEEETSEEQPDDEEESKEEPDEEKEVGSVDYEEIVDQNIDEIKEEVENSDLDLEKLLQAEKDNKDRKTLKNWIEKRLDS